MPAQSNAPQKRKLDQALYYPNIRFRDPKWVKAMALFYDRIFRIVPEGVRPDDFDALRPLVESGTIGKPINPEPYATKASEEFIDGLDLKWRASALKDPPNMKQELTKLHAAKTDEVVRQLFTEMGYEQQAEWINVPSGLASNFMLFLATRIAQDNGLALVTDDLAPWTGSTYFALDGQYHEVAGSVDKRDKGFYNPFSLFTLVMEELVPVNIEDIPCDKLLLFREKRKDELKELRRCISDVADGLAETKNSYVAAAKLHDAVEEMRRAIEEYKKSADLINAKAWFGISVMGIPAPTTIANILGMETIGTSIMVAAGIAIGAAYSLVSKKHEMKKLSKTMPYSSFALMDAELKPFSIKPGGRDPSFAVRNAMDEYVND